MKYHDVYEFERAAEQEYYIIVTIISVFIGLGYCLFLLSDYEEEDVSDIIFAYVGYSIFVDILKGIMFYAMSVESYYIAYDYLYSVETVNSMTFALMVWYYYFK